MYWDIGTIKHRLQMSSWLSLDSSSRQLCFFCCRTAHCKGILLIDKTSGQEKEQWKIWWELLCDTPEKPREPALIRGEIGGFQGNLFPGTKACLFGSKQQKCLLYYRPLEKSVGRRQRGLSVVLKGIWKFGSCRITLKSLAHNMMIRYNTEEASPAPPF